MAGKNEAFESFLQAQRSHTFEVEDVIGESFPEGLRKTTGLKKIALKNADMPLPYWLSELKSLKYVQIWHAGVPTAEYRSSLSEIKDLPNLETLVIHGFSDLVLDIDFSTIPNLKHLILTGNDNMRLANSLEPLQKLVQLDVSNCALVDLPRGLEALTKLKYLYAFANVFEKVPRAISGLKSLTLLELSSSGSPARPTEGYPSEAAFFPADISIDGAGLGTTRRLSGATTDPSPPGILLFPKWLIQSLPLLTHLYLGGHQIQTLPNIRSMHLEVLSLPDNQLQELNDSLADCLFLRVLDVRQNQLHGIPESLGGLRHLTYFGIQNNPINVPPEIAAESTPDRIFGFLSEIRRGDGGLNEAKLLVVGEGSVGKTSLVKRLVENEYSPNERKTEGIDVSHWLVSTPRHVSLSVWDFGGQEIMHATHQFFLTKRSLYILVLDARQDEEQNRIEYWLKLLDGFSDGSPVIIVGNKIDEAPMDIDVRGIQRKYSNVVAVVSVSCQDMTGIEELKAEIASRVALLPHVFDRIPSGFLAVKARLEAMHSDFITYAEYKSLCEAAGVATNSGQESLIALLHDLGTVICFKDDPRLTDTSILDPTWVTTGVYKILNSHAAAQSKGLLEWGQVKEILEDPRYPMDRRFFIVDMMMKFELCFESDGQLLVPDLLTKSEPDTGSWEGSLHFEIKYDVLPSSIMARFIVRMSRKISQGTVWRNGVIVSMDGNRALVKADKEEGLIIIDVLGPPNNRRGLLALIRGELHAIGQSVPGVAYEERVPVLDEPGVFVPYSHLLSLEAAGHSTVIPVGSTKEYLVRNMLAGIENPDMSVKSGTSSPGQVLAVEPSSQALNDGRVWSPGESLKLGLFILIALLVVLAGVGLAAYFLESNAIMVVGGTIALVVLLSIVVLRVSGRIGEETFGAMVKNILHPKSSSNASESE